MMEECKSAHEKCLEYSLPDCNGFYFQFRNDWFECITCCEDLTPRMSGLVLRKLHFSQLSFLPTP